MPIDFNPYVYNYVHQPIIEHPMVFKQCQPTRDTFIKSQDIDIDRVKVEKKSFGKIDKTGEIAQLYTITNRNGMSVDLSTFGATIVGIKVPDKDGHFVDVAQGYKNVTPYEKSPVGHAGGTIGPYANKISNGKFILNGKEYQLECNKDNGKSHSHGGTNGLDVQNWKSRVLRDGIEFSLVKKDMENGYPGNVKYKVIYRLDEDNKLHINYKVKSDKDTIVNLTNHNYFNLDGVENTEENSVLDHVVTLPNSSKVTLNSSMGIPTGEFMDVKGTPFDFSSETRIGDVINEDHEQLKIAKGFDQNYCVDNYDGKSLIEVAKVKSEKTGINLSVSTNLPGFQFYTANNLGKSTQPAGKHGTKYEKRSGFCVEPQFYPNAINTESFKEKGILKAGEEFNKKIVYSFSAE